MTIPALFCAGVQLPLAERIGRGGEGEVHAVADGSGRAVKLYSNPDAEREAKVRAIVDARLGAACPDVAFPLDIVRYADGRFAGFTMRLVAGHQPIHELITTSSRRRHFPKADSRFLAHTALNVARIVANLLVAGVVIGDINSACFLVAQNATVTLIDADSFQIRAHRCRVGMAEYTPPELQGTRFGTIDRTPDHDAFGLAVMLFQILTLGRHPYSGVARGRSLQIDQAITQGRFAYSLIRKVSAAPPPGAVRLDDLPRAIRLLFERAFATRSGLRPTAAEWVDALGTFASNLKPCPQRSNHHVAIPTAPCPWCRIERSTGRPIFPGGSVIRVASTAAPPSKVRDDAERTVRQARHHAGETVVPMWPRPATQPSKAALKILGSDDSPAHLPAVLRALQLAAGTRQTFFDRHDAARLSATRALEDWREKLGIWAIARSTDELRGTVERLHRVHRSMPSLIAQAAAKFATETATALMKQERIDAARISGIGEALRAQLARNAITTAADVTRPALNAIGGIGEARIVALLFWRETIAVAAEQASVRLAPQASRTASAETAVDAHARDLEHRIRQLIADIDTRVERVRKGVWLIDRRLDAALREQDQATTDLSHLGLAGIPRQTATPAHALPPPPAKTKAKSGKKRGSRICPRCGKPMVERWGAPVNGKPALFLGCSAYPTCSGTSSVRHKIGVP